MERQRYQGLALLAGRLIGLQGRLEHRYIAVHTGLVLIEILVKRQQVRHGTVLPLAQLSMPDRASPPHQPES